MIRGRLSTEELLWLLGLLEKSGVELVRLESAP
jgi:hypothetical protein